MKTVLLLVAAILFAALLTAQAPDWDWAVQGGGAQADGAMDICLDSSGNSYVTGYFAASAYFGSYLISASGFGPDVYVAKVNPDGSYAWVAQGGSSSASDYAYAIARDGEGYLYVCGTYSGAATFGVTTLPYSGGTDIFIAKLDANGNWLWAVNASGSGNEIANGIAADSDGNCYATGVFSGSVTFGSNTLTASAEDIWVAKLNSSGGWVWTAQAGGSSADQVSGIGTDASGNCYITGYFNTAASFGVHDLTSAGNNDIFVAKLDDFGVWQWAVRAGGSSSDWALDIATDSFGISWITGGFVSEVCSFGYNELSGDLEGSEIFAACVDPDGIFVWATGTAAEDSYDDWGESISRDGYGNAYICGRFLDTATFGATVLDAPNGDVQHTEAFAAKLDDLGNWLWAVQAGGLSDDSGQGIACLNGELRVAGGFKSQASFGTNTLMAMASYSDAFVASLDEGGGVQPPGMPVLLSPADGANNLSIDGFDLDWDSGSQTKAIESYVVYLAGDLSELYSQHQWTTSSSIFNPVTEGGISFAYGQLWYWTVKAINLGGETTALPPFSFTIQSGPIVSTFPATWDFEGPTFPPDGFAIYDSDGLGNTWVEDPYQNNTPGGSKCAVHYASDAGYQFGAMVLPAVLMPEDSFMTLSFQHRSDGDENYEYCSLLASTDPGRADSGWMEIWHANSVDGSWKPVYVDVTAYAGQLAWFAFFYQGDNANDWHVDDISIYEVEPVTSLPAVWDFEGAEFPPTGWSTQDNDGQDWYWWQDVENNHTPGGTKCARYQWSLLGDYGQDGWLITPPIVLPALRNPLVIDFWHNSFWMDYYIYSGVMVRPTGPGSTGWEEIWNPDSVTEEWQNVLLNISLYAGQTVQFAFVYRGSDGHDWFVDDVSIRELTGSDNLPPTISYLPQICTPRYDLDLTLTAEVVDDPIWQSAIDEVVLHYRAADVVYELPMVNEFGNTWAATIPPQELGTEVAYFFTAADEYENTASTGDWDNYRWFRVDNPVWVFYDWGITDLLGRQESYGVANRFANPFHELGLGLLLQQVALDVPQPIQANLHVYSDDGANLIDLTGPLPVDLNGYNYYYMPGDLVITTPYFYVSIEDIPAGGNNVWFDVVNDYGMSFWKEPGYFAEVEETGSWIIQALITNASLAAPEANLVFWDGVPYLDWEPVPYALYYHVFASSDPCAEDDDWVMIPESFWGATDYWPDPTEPRRFFRVMASNTQPVKADPAWLPEHKPHTEKATRLWQGRE